MRRQGGSDLHHRHQTLLLFLFVVVVVVVVVVVRLTARRYRRHVAGRVADAPVSAHLRDRRGRPSSSRGAWHAVAARSRPRARVAHVGSSHARARPPEPSRALPAPSPACARAAGGSLAVPPAAASATGA